jgi:hypothetical protein
LRSKNQQEKIGTLNAIAVSKKRKKKPQELLLRSPPLKKYFTAIREKIFF